jgi:hypothetical protein
MSVRTRLAVGSIRLDLGLSRVMALPLEGGRLWNVRAVAREAALVTIGAAGFVEGNLVPRCDFPGRQTCGRLRGPLTSRAGTLQYDTAPWLLSVHSTGAEVWPTMVSTRKSRMRTDRQTRSRVAQRRPRCGPRSIRFRRLPSDSRKRCPRGSHGKSPRYRSFQQAQASRAPASTAKAGCTTNMRSDRDPPTIEIVG